MSITALSVQQIVAVIQQQLAAPVAKGGQPPAPIVAPAGAPHTSRTEKEERAVKRTKPGLANLIGQRVAALQETDPDRGRKAFRIFLESLLLNQLGEHLVNDAAFYDMVDQVQKQIESDQGSAKLMHEAIAQLLAGASPTLSR